MKLYGADNTELLEVTSLGRQDNQLIIKGRAFGAMPITARLTAGEARAALRLLRPGVLLFLLTLPFRRGDP